MTGYQLRNILIWWTCLLLSSLIIWFYMMWWYSCAAVSFWDIQNKMLNELWIGFSCYVMVVENISSCFWIAYWMCILHQTCKWWFCNTPLLESALTSRIYPNTSIAQHHQTWFTCLFYTDYSVLRLAGSC